jgi:RimJ/RimL family protein N-acetyltransferase
MTNIPTIETERLLLRPHRKTDFETYAEFWADENIVRYVGGVPNTREQSWARLLRCAGMWHHMGFGFLAIEEKTSGHFVGECGFLDMHREMTPSTENTLETGWALTPSVQGRGYATEAMRAMIAWVEPRFPDKEMTCIIDPVNEASLRVAKKLGFREVTRTDYHGEIILLSRTGTRQA